VTSNHANGDAWHMTTTGTRADPPIWRGFGLLEMVKARHQIRRIWAHMDYWEMASG
jgi:hypothetical protein